MTKSSAALMYGLFYLFSAGPLSAQANQQSEVEAEAKTVADFKNQSVVIINALLSQGEPQLGSLDLRAFERRLVTVQVTAPAVTFHIEGPGYGFIRSSAEWRRASLSTGTPPRISVSRTRWAKTQSFIKPILALHEEFGALDYDFDQHYECSQGLAFLSAEETRKTLTSAELAQLKLNVEDKCTERKVASGSTGFGGGGDGTGVFIRALMFQNHLRKVQAATSTTERQRAFEELLGEFSVWVESGTAVLPSHPIKPKAGPNEYDFDLF